MTYQFSPSLALILLIFILSSCTTTPVAIKQETEEVATAKRFLHSIGAGELAMVGFQNSFEKMAQDQPGMAELVQRAFANFKAEDFEQLAATVYANHLNIIHLNELAQFSEKPPINRFFQLLFKDLSDSKPLKMNNIMRQFNADELTEIMKFVQSESFAMMAQSLPAINKELSEASRQLGESTLREYIKQH